MKTILLAAALVLAGMITGAGRATAEAGSSDLAGLLWPGNAPSRADARGGSVAASDLKDRLTIVSFASVGCSILCVTRVMELDRLARGLPAALRDRVVFLVLDTDPAADDAARLRDFADGLLGSKPRLRFLTANAEGTAALAKSLHYPAERLPEPPPTVLLFDRAGNLAMSYGGDAVDAPRLQRDLVILDTFTDGLDRAPSASRETTGPR